MVYITIYQNHETHFTGFDCEGHAEYAEPGEDIVCAAVSALVIGCINSIEMLTGADITYDQDAESGMISMRLEATDDHDSQLLIQSMVLSLQSVESNYEEYIDIIFEEV